MLDLVVSAILNQQEFIASEMEAPIYRWVHGSSSLHFENDNQIPRRSVINALLQRLGLQDDLEIVKTEAKKYLNLTF